MAISLEEQQKRQLAASLTVDLIKLMGEQLVTPQQFANYFNIIYDAIYGKLSEKA